MAALGLDSCGRLAEHDLARLYLTRAQEFLPSPDLAKIGPPGSVCHATSIAAELALKAWMLFHEWSDNRCRRTLRHDLEVALESALAYGPPARLPELTAILAVLNAYYPRHAFDCFVDPLGGNEFPARAREAIADLIGVVRAAIAAFTSAPWEPFERSNGCLVGRTTTPAPSPPGLARPDGDSAGDR